ncbi:MAG TPA: hypothetical protein VFF16_13535 [Telluria sp.]|nr:hypothetical protein [Telluria sp.]
MPALSTPAEIEALADQLGAAADALHRRIVQDLAARQGEPVPEADRAVLRQLLDDEMTLRQNANALYADAAARVVAGLPRAQASVMRLTADAAEKIHAIAKLSDGLGVVTALGAFAAAALSGQPAAIATAFDKLRRQVKAARADA